MNGERKRESLERTWPMRLSASRFMYEAPVVQACMTHRAVGPEMAIGPLLSEISARGTSSKLDFWVIMVHNRRAAILGTRKAYRHDG